MKTLLTTLLLIPTLAFAGGLNNQQQAQKQAQGQAQHQGQSQQSKSAAKAASGAAAGAISASVGNVVDNSGATGGSSDVAVDAGDTTVVNDYERQVAPAAPLFVDVCQSGFSGSFEDFGFSNVTADQYCTLLRQADVNWKAHVNAMRCKEVSGVPVCRSDCKPGDAMYKDGMPVPKCAAKCEAPKHNQCQATAESDHYLALYHKNLADAQELVDMTNTTGLIDRVSGQIWRVVSLLGILIWLI